MPQLEWDETDVLACLEVLPEVEEYGTSYCYKVQRDDLAMAITMWPHESIVTVSISRQAVVVASWTLAVRGFVRRVNDKRGERLEFCDCVLVAGRFAYIHGVNPFDFALFPGHLTMEMCIKPHIRIAFS